MRHDEWEEEYGEEEHNHVDAPGPFRIQCAFCQGTGVNPATMKRLDHETCPVCKGQMPGERSGPRVGTGVALPGLQRTRNCLNLNKKEGCCEGLNHSRK